MPTEQVLKKKLKGVVTTRKISKAMKTAATVKFSRLNAVYSGYSQYSDRCRELYTAFEGDFLKAFPSGKDDAPVCYIIIASNKGMCGSFNSELLNYAQDVIFKESDNKELILCGEKAITFFKSKGYASVRDYVFKDVPELSEAKLLYEELCALLREKEYSAVKVIYPRYVNMIKQVPCIRDLFNPESVQKNEPIQAVFIPDKETLIKQSAEKIVTSMLFGFILETAIGAQAATIMNMRSAYDAAVEYEEKLESEINRKRQGRVTSDVIETFAEYFREE